MQPPDMLRIVRGRGWIDMNFNSFRTRWRSTRVARAYHPRVSPRPAARRGPRRGPDLDRDRDGPRIGHGASLLILCTAMSSNSARAVLRSAGCQARHIASKQLQSQQRLIKPLRSRRYRGRVMYLNCHTVTAARRCTVWIRMPLVDSHSDAESGFGWSHHETDRWPRSQSMRGAQARVRSSGPLLGIPTTRTR